jgi:hypothetical protein
MKAKCYFTHNIIEILECSKLPNFDDLGFATWPCKFFPCKTWLEIESDVSLKYRLLNITTA